MLDTNIFNRLLDGKFELSLFPVGSSFWATKVQLEEIKRTSNPVRRADLLQTFEKIAPEIVPASFSLDIAGAGLDEGVLSNKSDKAKGLHNSLEALKQKFNNCHDAIIAEAAFFNSCVLVTADSNLANVAAEHGIVVYPITT